MAQRNGLKSRVIRRKGREDKDFIYAALGGLTLCVAALYMAVALPKVAPIIAPKFLDMRLAALGPAAGWTPAEDLTVETRFAVPSESRLEKPTQVMRVGSTEKLETLFEGLDYSLKPASYEQVEVPRVFLANMPSDLHTLSSADTRKLLFVQTMLPLILKANETILLERGQLLALRSRTEAGRTMTAEEASWLKDLAERYGVEGTDFDKLLRRVDIVPPSLALAQAAEESGWGTSRFVQQGNAAFGQYTFSEDTGLVPGDRADGKTHYIRSYDHLLDGVKSYARNLNTHAAYRTFRKERAEMRASGQEIDGYELAGNLTSYSERGKEYVDTIRGLIRANSFEPLDRARLRGGIFANLLSAGR